MGTFGIGALTGGTSYITTGGIFYLLGWYAQCPENCVATKMTIKSYTGFDVGGGGDPLNIQCAIYEYTDNSSSYAGNLVTNGTTNTVNVSNDIYLVDFTFSTNPTLVGGTNYYLCVRATENVDANVRSIYGTGGVIKGIIFDTGDPPTFESPLTEAYSSTLYIPYILVTYTATEAGVSVTECNNPKRIAISSIKMSNTSEIYTSISSYGNEVRLKRTCS